MNPPNELNNEKTVIKRLGRPLNYEIQSGAVE